MKECFEKAAEQFGAAVDVKIGLEYSSYNIPANAEIMRILERASDKAGIELRPGSTGGGSDTNIYNSRGIQSVDMSVGMDKVHSVEEQILIEDMVKAAEFLLAIVTSVI
jgi:tripeptide aminopeptidase